MGFKKVAVVRGIVLYVSDCNVSYDLMMLLRKEIGNQRKRDEMEPRGGT
jgi:hypothetical protein